MNAWHDLKDDDKWVGNTLQRNTFNRKTSAVILKWFADKAQDITVKANTDDDLKASFSHKLIIDNLMYRIAKTVLVLNNLGIHICMCYCLALFHA